MKKSRLRAGGFLLALCFSVNVFAQDTWSNVPPASDDRFTNPASAIYAGPNGWYNFGELRTNLAAYNYKGGLNSVGGMLVLVAPQPSLYVLNLDFGVDPSDQTLAAGTYTVGANADYTKREVTVGFGDTSNSKILSWDSAANAGTITVTHAGNFVYVYARKLSLAPSKIYNKGDNDQPLVLGLEGAIKQ